MLQDLHRVMVALQASQNTTSNGTLSYPPIFTNLNGAFRIAHVGFFLPLAILVLIGLIVFTIKKRQPLYSRFLAPWFGTIYLILKLVNDLVVYSLSLARKLDHGNSIYQYGDYYFLEYLLFLSFSAFTIQTVRYYVMRGMYKNISQSKKVSYIAAYKRFTSRKMYAAFCIIYTILAAGPMTVLTILRDASVISYSSWNLSVIIIEAVLGIALMVVIVGFFAFDFFVLNGHMVFRRCQWHKYFIGQDPLRFRLEIVVLLVGILAYVTTTVVNSASSTLGIIANPVGWAIGFFIVVFFKWIVWLFAFGGLIVVYTLVDTISQSRKAKNVDTESSAGLTGEQRLYKVIEDVPDGYNLISDYCKVELSSENLIAWTHVKKLIQQLPSLNENERRHELELIYELFLDSDAEMEINIQNTVRQEFLRAIGKGMETPRKRKNADDRSEEQRQLDALISLNKGIVENISDTFSRLEDTKAFKLYWASMEAKSRILEKANMTV